MIGVKTILSRGLIFGVLVLGASTIGLWFKVQHQQSALDDFWQTMQQDKVRINELEGANERLDGTVQQLTDQRERDSEAISGLIERMRQLDSQDDETRARLDELEKSNAATREYLDSLVDPAVSCLLDPACNNDSAGAGGGVRGSASAADAAMRTAKPHAAVDEPRPREWLYRMAFRRHEM